MASGSPCSTPSGAPLARTRSAWSASASACSGSSSVTIAFTRGLTAAIRSRCASITSRAENAPSRIPAASSVAVRPHMGADSTVRRVPFEYELRVRYGECDPQGIVFNANYLAFFDVAFTELWRSAVVPWQQMAERGYDAVVAEARLAFRSPARFDDVITLELTPAKLGRTSITTALRILRGADLLVDGELRLVVLSAETWRPVEMPDWIRSGLESVAI